MKNNSVLKKEFKSKDVERLRNLVKGKYGERTTMGTGYTKIKEFHDEGRFKSKHDEPAVGRSLMMSPFTFSFTWQTTDITEIVEQRENYIKFNTRNSVYELFHLK